MSEKAKKAKARPTRKPPKAVARSARKVTAAKASSARPVPRLRITMGKGLILGPGKVDLLESIDRKGSISAAARDMDMSYRRAWLLVEALNQMFSEPVVVAATGGARGGGAQITDFGRKVAAAYRRIEQKTRTAIREELKPLDPNVDLT